MEEVLIKTEGVNVRILGLGAGEEIHWHYHTEVADYIFALDGEIEIQLKEPDENVLLAPGQRYKVATRRIHRVVNVSNRENRYLLIQGIGRYDFNKVDS